MEQKAKAMTDQERDKIVEQLVQSIIDLRFHEVIWTNDVHDTLRKLASEAIAQATEELRAENAELRKEIAKLSHTPDCGCPICQAIDPKDAKE